MSDIEFGVVEQPEPDKGNAGGNGQQGQQGQQGQRSEPEYSTKNPADAYKPKSADNLPKKGRGD